MTETESDKHSSFRFTDFKEAVGTILTEWRTEEWKIKLRKEIRDDEKDVEQLVTQNAIPEDGTYIPVRVISRRIRQEIANQISILRETDRLIILTDKNDPTASNEDLEHFFTTGMRYPGWLIPWIRALDSADLHGGAAVEVRFDPTKPLFCAVEAIPRENLIFPLDAYSLQACEHIIRRFKFMPFELESFVKKYGFNQRVVDYLVRDRSQMKRNEPVEVYRVFTKKDGIVYIWWHNDNADDFLKAPEPLYMGIIPKEEYVVYMEAQKMGIPYDVKYTPMTEYPVMWIPYEITEDERLIASKGRAFRDVADQEVLTQLWTAVVNSAIRASNVYASRTETGIPVGAQVADDKIKPNQVYSQPVSFHFPPFPGGEVLGAIQQYDVAAEAANGQFSVAVMSRRDTRKTATEISAVRQMQLAQAAAAASMYTHVIVEVYALCWKIACSQMALGNIKHTFDPQRLFKTYQISSAVEQELIVREKRSALIEKLLPVLGNTQLAPYVLSYLLETEIPDKAKEWSKILLSGNPVQLIAHASQLLKSVPSIAPNLTQDQLMQLAQFTKLMDEYVSAHSGQSNQLLGLAEQPADTEATLPAGNQNEPATRIGNE